MINILSYLSVIKKYHGIILIGGFLYASAIIFPDFGPILLHVVGQKSAIYMGSFAMFVMIIGFIFDIGSLSKLELAKNYLVILGLPTIAITCLFTFLPIFLQFLCLAVFAFTIGRFGVFWTRLFLNTVPHQLRGHIIGASLCIAYGILYLSNIVVPSLPTGIVPSISSILMLSSIFIYQFSNKEFPKSLELQTSEKTNFSHPLKLYFLYIIIYITAGFTYVNIYPKLSPFYHIERLYNVLPFVISVPLVGYISDIKGRKYLLFFGIGLLGLSFIFFSFELTVITYFLIQTTLQEAWVFLDVFVFVITADIAEKRKCYIYYNYGLAAMIAGVTIGSILSFTINQYEAIYKYNIELIAYLPLFLSTLFLVNISETLHSIDNSSNMRNSNQLNIPNFEQLTKREKEISLLLCNDLSNKEISEKLSISINTLKTHLRNIYRKTKAKNRKELKKLSK